MKRAIAFLSFALVFAVVAFAQTSQTQTGAKCPMTKQAAGSASCEACCHGSCEKDCCKNGCDMKCCGGSNAKMCKKDNTCGKKCSHSGGTGKCCHGGAPQGAAQPGNGA